MKRQALRTQAVGAVGSALAVGAVGSALAHHRCFCSVLVESDFESDCSVVLESGSGLGLESDFSSLGLASDFESDCC